MVLKYFSVVLTVFLVFGLQSANADKVMYCSEQVSGGLSSKSGSWKSANFQEERYTVKMSDDYSRLEKGLDIFDCRPAFAQSFRPHIITCFQTAQYMSVEDRSVVDFGGQPKVFFFDSETLRFVWVSVNTGGFLTDKGDTDSVSGGKCDSF